MGKMELSCCTSSRMKGVEADTEFRKSLKALSRKRRSSVERGKRQTIIAE